MARTKFYLDVGRGEVRCALSEDGLPTVQTQKFYFDAGGGEIRCRLTLDGNAKYSAVGKWTDDRIISAVEERRFQAQQVVQKCDEWLDAWKRGKR